MTVRLHLDRGLTLRDVRLEIGKKTHRTMKVLDVIDYCCEQPEIRSWLDFFDDPTEETAAGDAEDAVVDDEGVPGVEDDSDVRR